MSAASLPGLGELRDRVELQRRDLSQEDEGGVISTFVPIATVRARVRALSARQMQAADGRAVTITHAVVLRYRTDLQPGDRFVFAGRKLELVAANDLNGRRAYLNCTCNETAVMG